jgi:hypothetical protein
VLGAGGITEMITVPSPRDVAARSGPGVAAARSRILALLGPGAATDETASAPAAGATTEPTAETTAGATTAATAGTPSAPTAGVTAAATAETMAATAGTG